MTPDDLRQPLFAQHIERLSDALLRGVSLRFAYNDADELYQLAKKHSIAVPDELNDLRLQLAKARVPEIKRIKDAWFRAGDNPTYVTALNDLRAGDWQPVVNMLRARYPIDFDAFARFCADRFKWHGGKVDDVVAEDVSEVALALADLKAQHDWNDVPASERDQITLEVSTSRALKKLVGDRAITSTERERLEEKHLQEIEKYQDKLEHRIARRDATPSAFVDAYAKPHHLARLFYERAVFEDAEFDRLADFIREKSAAKNGRPVEYWQKLAANRAALVWKSFVHSHDKTKMPAARKPAIVASVCREVEEMYGCGPIEVDGVLDLLNRAASRRVIDPATTP